MKYLVDTNVWLEILLNQKNAKKAIEFLHDNNGKQLYLSDFSLHSIGVILSRYRKYNAFEMFINDIYLNSGIKILTIFVSEMSELIANIKKYSLDFDDAYQLTIAKKYDLTIVSFDKDFDIEGISKISP